MRDSGLEGKVAVVTGGGGILCSHMCMCLAEAGMKVVAMDLYQEKVDKVAAEIKKAGGEALALAADVTSPESLKAARDRVVEHFGGVHLLLNGAGGNHPDASTGDDKSFMDLKMDGFKFVFNLNIIGTVVPCQIFLPELLKDSESCIINISSMSATLPLTKVVGYSAAKAAIDNFTRWLAVHVSQNYNKSVRVNAIAPGFLLTDQNRFLLQSQDGKATPRGETIMRGTPMGRYGEPDELVGAVLWLASRQASFVHGAIIPIDGGFSAFSGV
ncbi:MAG: SDR family oxidoreductase [Planctomycetes bacterium]|nr:SDR family oxidoreductase [Planctomycetota bacterium]